MSERAPATPRTRVTARVRELRFDAGSLSLDLVATVGRRPSTPVERLGDHDRLRAWCQGVGLTVRDGEDRTALLGALHELRSAATDVATAAVDGRAPRPESVGRLNDLARVEPPAPRLRVDSKGRPAAGTEPLSSAQLLSVVARDLIALVTDPRLRERLGTCAAEVCGMVYLDPGSGKLRKWCSMERCGNNAKAARHRHRASASGSTPTP
ncbi:CGNR zinc finger domain-containing protein [Actinacidiphila glaucinigra]|nr:CGNR zinc finger domain-containing protein [Actinacidiphila glaucinigra]WSD64170.1 ABATE domain-containing protein [Actinacidiphila glaucinigra]